MLLQAVRDSYLLLSIQPDKIPAAAWKMPVLRQDKSVSLQLFHPIVLMVNICLISVPESCPTVLFLELFQKRLLRECVQVFLFLKIKVKSLLRAGRNDNIVYGKIKTKIPVVSIRKHKVQNIK